MEKNECYGIGNVRLWLDDKSYLKCSGDMSTIVRYTYSVAKHDNTPYCKVPKCMPKKYEYEDKVLNFVTGEIWCIGNDDGDTK